LWLLAPPGAWFDATIDLGSQNRFKLRGVPTALYLNHVDRHLISAFGFDASTVDDISYSLRDLHVESIATASDFGRLAFWFSPRLRVMPDDVNRPATELLLASTRFSASTVPLLRGRWVLTSHDSRGNPAGLADEQIVALAHHVPSWRHQLILDRRYNIDGQVQRRIRMARRAANRRAAWGPSLRHRSA
jgi:hypothetical protein